MTGFTVVGNVGHDPQRRSTSKGEVVHFRVACTPRSRTESGDWRDGDTVWYDVSAWERLGDVAETTVRRGQRVIVQGTLQLREYAARDGGTRHSNALRADAIGHDITDRRTSRSAAAATQPSPAASQSQSVLQPGATEAAPGDWGAPSREPVPAPAPAPAPAAQEPAPAGWSTLYAAEEETPF